MTNYRVAAEDESNDPLAVELSIVESQQRSRGWVVHVVLTLCSLGLWLPFALYFLSKLYGAGARKEAESYRVRVARGVLEAGSASTSSTIPLDQIVTVSVSQGYVNVGIKTGSPVQLFGLRDPRAASAAILSARDEYLRSLGGSRGELAEELAGAHAAKRRAE